MNREAAFPFLPLNARSEKPRHRGVTEIRGPYYSPFGKRELLDLLETMGPWIDILKFGGGSFVLTQESALREIISIAHDFEVRVSTGGFLEWVLAKAGPDAVRPYLDVVTSLGFDIVEVSSGFISIPDDDLVTLARECLAHGFEVKPEVNFQFGAGGGSTTAEQLEAEGATPTSRTISLARSYLEAGASMIMVESEGLTENVREWRTRPIMELVEAIGLEPLMFEAADPQVFGWYVKTFGPDVNLFVDHSQIVQLEALRSGVWAEASLFGRVVTYRGGEAASES